MELDEAFRYIGKLGRYQIFIYFLMSFYCCWLSGVQLTGIIFVGYVPKTYYCTPPNGYSANETTPMTEVDNGTMEIDRCHMYEVGDDGIVTTNLTDCVYGWDYESVSGEVSLVTDVSILCIIFLLLFISMKDDFFSNRIIFRIIIIICSNILSLPS